MLAADDEPCRGRAIAARSADVLWKFRWYSLINQLLIWTVTALVFGTLLERYLNPPQPNADTEPAEHEPALS